MLTVSALFQPLVIKMSTAPKRPSPLRKVETRKVETHPHPTEPAQPRPQFQVTVLDLDRVYCDFGTLRAYVIQAAEDLHPGMPLSKLIPFKNLEERINEILSEGLSVMSIHHLNSLLFPMCDLPQVEQIEQDRNDSESDSDNDHYINTDIDSDSDDGYWEYNHNH